MTTEELVRQARNPQEAMLAIAQALDRLETPPLVDEWSASQWSVEPTAPQYQTTSIQGDSDNTEVIVPPASPEKQERRRMFERQQLKLSEYLGNDDEDWTEAYAKGGPRWLYYGNRELVMSYPDSIKQAMIEDIIEDSPQEAHDIGRDLLKAACETGPGGTGMKMADEL